ncbi:MAG: hypothetical protein NTX51_20555, partial [Verrucomicrobia bacterium]|nr:hypothetical protein [Verrucomicrobiota bacterium]
YFAPASVLYTGGQDQITATLQAPRRNPPKEIRLRFRAPSERPPLSVTVNGKPWKKFNGEWVRLPGDIGSATVVARYANR